jgi:hypothetical protein
MSVFTESINACYRVRETPYTTTPIKHGLVFEVFYLVVIIARMTTCGEKNY